jgi:hemerythrin
MWLAQYHGLDEHRAIHDGMRQHINQMVESDGGGPDIAIGKALEFLTNWLIDHINTADRQMASHVRNYLSQASYWHVPRERESG